MKAELSENGLMVISPETATEAYALRRWVESASVNIDDEMRAERCYWRGSKIMTDAEWPREKEE